MARCTLVVSALISVSATLLPACGSNDSGGSGGTGGTAGGDAGVGGNAGDASAGTGGGGEEAGTDSGPPVVGPDPCVGDDGSSPSGPTFFVAPGGAGDGTSWQNAWSDVSNIDWGAVDPGSTICIAGGTYGNLSLEGSGSANARICIKRAVAGDESCGAASTGWNAAYDAQVVLSGISCNSTGQGEYVTVDGRVAYGGIKIDDQSLGESYAISLNQGQPNYLRLVNLDVAGISTLSTDFTGEGRCLSAISSGTTHGLYIAYSRFHGKPTLILTAGQHDMVFERNRLYDNVVGNPAAWHPNLWVSVDDDVNVAWRYNDISNWMVEGIMMCPNGSGCTPDSDWYIYGNVWHDAQGSSARVLEGQYVTHGPVYVYNNTFANIASVTGSQGNGGTFSSGMATNNLLWNTSAGWGAWNISETSNLEPTSDPFVDVAGSDYHLAAGAAPIDSGTAIPSQAGFDFDTDPDGNVRGADGKWDVGAFEH